MEEDTGSTLSCNVLERVGLREPDVSDHDDEYIDNGEGALGGVYEFPGSIGPEVSEKKEVAEAQLQPQAPIFNRTKTSKPADYDDIPEVGGFLRDNTPVILNLNYMGKLERQRMVDPVPGLRFGLGRKLELVGENLSLLTPKGIATVTDQKQTPFFLPPRY